MWITDSGQCYRLWVYQQPVQDVDELKRRLIDCWSNIQQAIIIDQAIDQWRVSLRACIQARDGHFEHLL